MCLLEKERTCFIRQEENIAHSDTSPVKNALHNLKPWNAAQEQSSPRQLPPQTLKSQCAIFKNYQQRKKTKAKCKIIEQNEITYTLKQTIHKNIYKIHSQVWFEQKAIVQGFNILVT